MNHAVSQHAWFLATGPEGSPLADTEGGGNPGEFCPAEPWKLPPC